MATRKQSSRGGEAWNPCGLGRFLSLLHPSPSQVPTSGLQDLDMRKARVKQVLCKGPGRAMWAAGTL